MGLAGSRLTKHRPLIFALNGAQLLEKLDGSTPPSGGQAAVFWVVHCQTDFLHEPGLRSTQLHW